MRERLIIVSMLGLLSLGVAACGSGSSDSAAAATSAVATSLAAAGTSDPAPSGTGTLTLVYRPAADATDLGDLSTVAGLISEQLTSAGYLVHVTGDAVLTIEVGHVAEGERDAIVAAVGLDARRVLIRPVLLCSTPDTPTSAPAGGTASVPATSGGSDEVVAFLGGGECAVGPAAGDATIFEADAAAEILGANGWGVVVSLREGAAGNDVFNAIAAACYAGDATCPSRQIAIEIDGEIVSAPTVQVPEFVGTVQIAGAFAEPQARQLASALRAGALAGRLTPDAPTFTPD